MVCKNTEKNVQRICHVRRFTTCPTSRKSAFTQPFFSSETQTELRKQVQWGKRGFYLLLQPHQCSSRAGDVSACTPSLWYLELPLLSTFFKGYKQPALTSTKISGKLEVTSGKAGTQLLWWRSPTAFAVLKKTPTFICQRYSKTKHLFWA